MSRLPALATVPAAAGALAVALSGCGSDPVPKAAAASTVSPPPGRQAVVDWPAPAAVPGARAARLSDEFNRGGLHRWGYFEGDYGRNHLRVRDGRLEVVPPKSTWVDAHRAFYLYRGVRGDFDVRARVRVLGRRGATPRADWSLSGLLVRRPAGPGDPEQWIALRTGEVGGRRVIERKTTTQSHSRLSLVDAGPGWTELRVTRRGSHFSFRSRAAGAGRWTARGGFVRADLPPTLQVGIDAFSGYGGSRADLRAQVDWVRFARS